MILEYACCENCPCVLVARLAVSSLYLSCSKLNLEPEPKRDLRVAAYVECKIHPSLAPLLALISVAGLCYFSPTLKPFPYSTHAPPPPIPVSPTPLFYPLTPDRREEKDREKTNRIQTFKQNIQSSKKQKNRLKKYDLNIHEFA